jgi:hypothetical protein
MSRGRGEMRGSGNGGAGLDTKRATGDSGR